MKPTNAEVERVARLMTNAARRESIRIGMIPIRTFDKSDAQYKLVILASARAAIKALQKPKRRKPCKSPKSN